MLEWGVIFSRTLSCNVSIQKWGISVQAKAAAISQPQAQQRCDEDCEERERRPGPKDAVYE
jgi:hypothetical protein